MNQDFKNFVLELAKENKRNRGERNAEGFRNIIVETGISENAEGSAKVSIGDTTVIAGVKMSIGEPYSDTPNRGNLVCSGELSPISDPEFEPGPPREDAIELSRVVDRGIRESESVDFEKLCIKEGEKVWNIFVDFYILNNDGNLIDACGLASIAALKSARMPKLDDEGKIVLGEWTAEKVPFKRVPIPVTFIKVGDKLLVDPDVEEEKVGSVRLTVTCSDKEVNALQKGGEGGLTLDEIDYCLTKSFKIREKIVEVINQIK